MPGTYPTDPEVRAEILKLRGELKLTNRAIIATLLIPGVTETFLSEYINDRLQRKVDNFEVRFRDTVKSLRERIAFGSAIFETSVTRRMKNAFDLIRSTGSISLVTSKAGNGKTSGIRAYCRDNPSAISITLNATTRSANKVESLVFRTIDAQSWRSNTPRFEFLTDRFREVSRLLIVDNAQRLDASGRQWLFDFQDEADCPIGLVGNPDRGFLGRIIGNDQQSSRIGINPDYELEADELPAAAKRVAQQFSDRATAEEIEDLVAFIAAHDGRLRSVKMTVILAQQLRAASAKLKNDPRAAIRSAHSRLIRDYLLPVD